MQLPRSERLTIAIRNGGLLVLKGGGMLAAHAPASFFRRVVEIVEH